MKMNSRKAVVPVLVFLSVLAIAITHGPAWSQEDASSPSADQEVGTQSEAATAEAPQLTEIERVMRLERDLEADQKRLEEIKADLAAREDLVTELSEDIKEAEVDLAAKKGVIPRQRADRKKSRLAKQLNKKTAA